jgi:hypothetical protein
MTIKDYKQFLNSLPEEFDDFEITHREYTTIDGDSLNAQEVPVYSVHVDESQKKACNMHQKSYELYQEFTNMEKIEVPNVRIPMSKLE